MGKITQKDIDALPESEKKKVDNAKKEVAKGVRIDELVKRTEYLDKKIVELINIVDDIASDLHRVMNRMGL